MKALTLRRWWWRYRWRLLRAWWVATDTLDWLYCRATVVLGLRDPRSCRVCGRTDLDGWDPSGQLTYCHDHCPDHDYRYDRSIGGHWCSICSKPVPDDWYCD